MKRFWLISVVVLADLAACNTRPNAAFCCITAEDCAANGVPDELRPCAAGQACVDNGCTVASCSTEGCAATAPVCDIGTDVCTGCSDSSECARFPDSDVCDTTSGSCVECVADPDCNTAEPICEGGSCRGCKLDSECSSGACGDDGACVAESEIVYVSPTGANSGECPREAPCQTVRFAIGKTGAARTHIVLSPGTYLEEAAFINSSTTPAPRVDLHGGGATVRGTNFETLFANDLPTSLRNLVISYPGLAISANSTTTIEHVRCEPCGRGLNVDGPVTARDLRIQATSNAIEFNSGSLTVDGAILHGGTHAILAGRAGTVDLTNVLAFGTSDVAFDFAATIGATTGSLNFVTIADSGTNSSTASGIRCGGALTIRSSVVWTANTARTPIVGVACVLVSTIAGPTAVGGAMNIDPLFVDQDNKDFHLGANSPARDLVDTGPATDFEGGPRPTGVRFDLGADETP